MALIGDDTSEARGAFDGSHPREIPRLRVPALRAKEKTGHSARNDNCEGEEKSLTPEGVSYIRKSLIGDWRSQVDARSTPGRARAANSGGKPPHST
jgi:hypothetical protein